MSKNAALSYAMLCLVIHVLIDNRNLDQSCKRCPCRRPSLAAKQPKPLVSWVKMGYIYRKGFSLKTIVKGEAQKAAFSLGQLVAT